MNSATCTVCGKLKSDFSPFWVFVYKSRYSAYAQSTGFFVCFIYCVQSIVPQLFLLFIFQLTCREKHKPFQRLALIFTGVSYYISDITQTFQIEPGVKVI